jgi:hypothetical protein
MFMLVSSTVRPCGIKCLTPIFAKHLGRRHICSEGDQAPCMPAEPARRVAIGGNDHLARRDHRGGGAQPEPIPVALDRTHLGPPAQAAARGEDTLQ